MDTRRPRGIKRACIECRQQKLRCDVVKEPFFACSRCRRLHLDCKIDATFKRTEIRRSKFERQQLETRRRGEPALLSGETESQLISQFNVQSLPTVPTTISPSESGDLPAHPVTPRRPVSEPSASGQIQSHETATLDQVTSFTRKLDGVELGSSEIQHLFRLYFDHYHQFLPFLDSSKSPDFYYTSSRLLFWTIISVASRRYDSDLTLLPCLLTSLPRLLWSVLQSVTHNYHDVKALCLLCTWPFPISSSSRDPTFMLNGTMMHLAMQIGLHRPSQAQDFSQFRLRLPLEELQDRIATWTTCKIVAQSVSTGYGQLSFMIHDDALYSHVQPTSTHGINQELSSRLRLEKICAKISQSLNSMSSLTDNSNGSQHVGVMNLLFQELSQLEAEIVKPSTSITLLLYLRCAQLHLRLHTLFDSHTSENYIPSLLSLYQSCETLLIHISSTEDIIRHCPNYIYQMTVASGFVILRLFNSPFTEHTDPIAIRTLFNSAISTIRKISVSSNDLAGRLAEVLAQLKARGKDGSGGREKSWQGLELKVRSRMSMSIMYDSLWDWRRGFEIDESRPSSKQASREDTSDQLCVSAAPVVNTYVEQDNASNTQLAVEQDFELNDLAFDDFYPVNWIIENAADMATTNMPGIMAPESSGAMC